MLDASTGRTRVMDVKVLNRMGFPVKIRTEMVDGDLIMRISRVDDLATHSVENNWNLRLFGLDTYGPLIPGFDAEVYQETEDQELDESPPIQPSG